MPLYKDTTLKFIKLITDLACINILCNTEIFKYEDGSTGPIDPYLNGDHAAVEKTSSSAGN